MDLNPSAMEASVGSTNAERLGEFLQRNQFNSFNELRRMEPGQVTIDLTDIDSDDSWDVGKDVRIEQFNLKGCTIICARFSCGRFIQNALTDVTFRACIFEACTFRTDQPRDVTLEDCFFEACTFESIVFRNMHLVRCVFDADDAGTQCQFDAKCVFAGASIKSNAFPSVRVMSRPQADILRKLLVRGITSPRPTRSKREQ